jgi:hypothetical protein
MIVKVCESGMEAGTAATLKNCGLHDAAGDHA